jgi:hypothetical protein
MHLDGCFADLTLKALVFHPAFLFFRLEPIISMPDPLIVASFVDVKQGTRALAGNDELVVTLLFRR